MTDDPKPKKKKKRWWLRILMAPAVLFVICHIPVGRVEIEIGYDTTRIDGPLNDDGTVDYVAALDAEYGKGVTRDDNAAYLLFDVFGTEMVAAEVRTEVLGRLAFTGPGGTRPFTSWEDWIAANPADAGAEKRPAQIGELLEAALEGQPCPSAAGWLEANEAALAGIVEASGRRRLYIPLVSPSVPPRMLDQMCWNLTEFKGASNALIIRAMLAMDKGRTDRAMDDVLAVYRLARLVRQCPNMVTHLVGLGMESPAAKASAQLATRGGLTAVQARRMIDALAGLQPGEDVVDVLDSTRRYFILDSFTLMSRGMVVEGTEQNARPNLDWNEMLRIANHWFDKMVAASRKASAADRKAAHTAYESEFEQMHADVGHWSFGIQFYALKYGGWPCRRRFSRLMADLLLSQLMPSLTRIVESQHAARTQQDVTIVAFAAAAFHAEHGRWPARLEELAPKYIARIPQDRFSSANLTYRLHGDGYVLYSVGPNMHDDGGVHDEYADKDDIVVEAK